MRFVIQFFATVVVGLALAGCKPAGGSGTESGAPSIDASALLSQFSSADASVKSAVESAVESVKAGKYSDAVASLQKLASDIKLTPDQQTAVKRFLSEVQTKAGSVLKEVGGAASKVATDAVNSAGDAANKAASDVKQGLGK